MRRSVPSQSSVESISPMPALFVKPSQQPFRKSTKSTLPPLNTAFCGANSSSSDYFPSSEKRSPISPVRSTHNGGISRSHTSNSGYASFVHHSESHVPKHRSSAAPPLQRSPTGTAEKQRTSPNSIPHLRDALNTLESQMATLMFERRMLERKLERAVRLQSPIQRLPGELLGSIFHIGVLQPESEDTILLSTLMLVCKEWAELTINTPALWSRIVIENRASIAKARHKLVRSKGVPLDVIIQFSPQFEHTQTVTELVIHAMDLLRPAIWRWRSFLLAVPSRSQAHAALMQCREPAPLLENFSVQIYHFMQEDRFAKPPLPLFQGHLPNLRTCSFTSFNFGWDVGLVSHLRVLKLGGFWNGFAPSVETVMSILRACPALEEFALRNMSDIESGICSEFSQFDAVRGESVPIANSTYFPKASDMVHMPRLRRASFYNAGVERMHAVFSQLSFPILERLEFSFMDNLTPIIKHLKRQSFTSLPITHLRVESCFFDELKFLNLLARFPFLKTLELVDVEDISSNFLKGLSFASASQQWICPKLEKLSFDGCSTIDWDALRSLVESRLPPMNSSQRMLNPQGSIPFIRGNSMVSSSASSYAAQQQKPQNSSSASSYSAYGSTSRSSANRSSYSSASATGLAPKRLKVVDLTRCHQFSREMIQWLRMYVAEVRCETVKTYWGEYGFGSP